MRKNGKKLLGILTALLLCVMMIGVAAAETIQPLPAKNDIAHLRDCFVTTDITYLGKGIARLTLYEDERFDGEAIRAVKAGDVIATNGEEVTVETVTWEGPDVVFNQGKETEMLFCDAGDGTFEHVLDTNDEIPQVLVGTLEQEILPYITVIEGVNIETGEMLENYELKTGEYLLKLLETNEGPCFDVKNVRILYDNYNQPTLIWRYYSPLA